GGDAHRAQGWHGRRSEGCFRQGSGKAAAHLSKLGSGTQLSGKNTEPCGRPLTRASIYCARPLRQGPQPANDKNPPRASSMIELEQEDPIPQGDLALQITALPRETNGFGDIYGGWLVSQMDLAGTAMASKVAGGRVATVAIDRMAFLVPVAVGAQLSFYTQTLEIGRSSIQMLVEVWSDDPLSSEW